MIPAAWVIKIKILEIAVLLSCNLQASDANRVTKSVLAHVLGDVQDGKANASDGTFGSICDDSDKVFILSYTNGQSGEELEEASVTYDLSEMRGKPLFEKWTDWAEVEGGYHHQTKLVYIADCSDAKIMVQRYVWGKSSKTPGKKKWKKQRGSDDDLCIGTGAMLDGCAYGYLHWRSESVGENEELRLLNPDPEQKYFATLTSGSVQYGLAPPRTADEEEQTAERAANSSSGMGEVTLQSTSGIKMKKLPSGCYCCGRSWYGLSPFSYVTSESGYWVPRRHKCMLAWRMVGNFVRRGAKDRVLVNNSAGEMFTMVPEFILTLANTFTLTLGQHALCALTCPFRKKPEFEKYSISFTKVL